MSHHKKVRMANGRSRRPGCGDRPLLRQEKFHLMFSIERDAPCVGDLPLEPRILGILRAFECRDGLGAY